MKRLQVRLHLLSAKAYRFHRFVHPHVPIFSYTQQLDPIQTKPFLLAAIYLLALPFATFDDYLSVQVVYALPDAEKLRKLAMDAVLHDMHHPGLHHLQTLILLVVAPPANSLIPDCASNWSLVGMMAAMAQTLGLQLDPTGWNLSANEVGLRKRLSWVVKMIDIWHAAVLGRSCLISDDDWVVSPPDLGDFSFEEISTTFPARFIQMYELTSILHGVLTSLL